MRLTKWVRLAAVATIGLAGAAVPSGAHAARATEHCVLQVTGELDTGELVTAPIECTSDSVATGLLAPSSSVIARHYTGYNWTGSELDILGTSCSGGWLNMPPGWVNVIESTASICTVDHYDRYNLTGAYQTLWSPGGNLTTLSQRTNSAVYY
jgi:hypothetical protein